MQGSKAPLPLQIHPSIHQLYVWLAQQLAAHQAQRPAGASSASSHGVGYFAAVPDPERRIHRQHSNHDRGGGQFDSRVNRKRCSVVVRVLVEKAEDVGDVAGGRPR